VKNKECGDHNEYKADAVIPSEFVPKIKRRKDRKDRERNGFLNGFQLRGSELVRAEAVRGNLVPILIASSCPAPSSVSP
jgi:hypothetical protein